MVTYDDDSIRLRMDYAGTPVVPLAKIGMEWPPPERIYLGGKEEGTIREAREGDNSLFVMRRISMSEITDEQRATMTHVFRGAEYVYERKAGEHDT